jgi:hypothetical protein
MALKSIVAGCGVAGLTLLLAACSPSPEDIAKFKEEERLRCLDHLCQGDKLPQYDYWKNELLKLNGQWFIGTKRYFSSGFNGATFYWPSKTPGSSSGDFPEKALEVAGKGDMVTVWIFLRHNPYPKPRTTAYQLLLDKEQQGMLVEKFMSPADDQEIWRVYDDPSRKFVSRYYVAKDLEYSPPGAGHPVLGCSDRTEYQEHSNCTAGFRWRDGISADIRVHQRHAYDWPAIYQEIIRVLSLLQPVKN